MGCKEYEKYGERREKWFLLPFCAVPFILLHPIIEFLVNLRISPSFEMCSHFSSSFLPFPLYSVFYYFLFSFWWCFFVCDHDLRHSSVNLLVSSYFTPYFSIYLPLSLSHSFHHIPSHHISISFRHISTSISFHHISISISFHHISISSPRGDGHGVWRSLLN